MANGDDYCVKLDCKRASQAVDFVITLLLMLLCQIRAVSALAIQCTVWSIILAVAAAVMAGIMEPVSHTGRTTEIRLR